jgi:hypothetical protein
MPLTKISAPRPLSFAKVKAIADAVQDGLVTAVAAGFFCGDRMPALAENSRMDWSLGHGVANPDHINTVTIEAAS